MSSVSTFIKNIWQKPPLLFSLAAVFYVFMTLYTLWTVRTAPFPGYEWLQVLWIISYTIAWLFVCNFRRWAAWLYLFLTSVNIILMLAVKSHDMKDLLTNSLFPTDILFCFFILFYYKRFE